MTLTDWLKHTVAVLDKHSDSAAFDAALLAEHVLNLSPTQQRYHNPELSLTEIQTLSALLARRQVGEPMAYILGHQPFYDMDFQVTPDTLIPRPETEHLLEAAFEKYPPHQSHTIADLGTGSGALAISFAKHRPLSTVIAVDRSLSALKIAQQNAANLATANVHFLHSDWLTAFGADALDAILSNPPYIDGDDSHLNALRFEPRTALVADDKGYADLFTIVRQAERVLKPQGWLMLEHGYQQGTQLRLFVQQRGKWQYIETQQDYAGHERVTIMRLSP